MRYSPELADEAARLYESGLSVARVADELGVSPPMVRCWIKDKVTWRKYRKINHEHIQFEIQLHPEEPSLAMAKRISAEMGWNESTVRQYIASMRRFGA